MFLEGFRARQILVNFCTDERARFLVFLIFRTTVDKRVQGEYVPPTFHCEHEIVKRVLVLLVGLGIVLLDVLLDGPLYDFDGALYGVNENSWTCRFHVRRGWTWLRQRCKGGVVNPRRNRSNHLILFAQVFLTFLPPPRRTHKTPKTGENREFTQNTT
jgi:hypothetical protein